MTLRIALYSSKRPRCGIATYTDYLEGALRAEGSEVRHWGSQSPAHVLPQIAAWNPAVFHVQHEQAIMPPSEVLLKFANELFAAGGRNVLTLHTETPSSAYLAAKKAFSATIVHKPPALLREAHILPMPCPVQDGPGDRPALRRKYAFPEDAFVVSTLGFMLPWKKTVEIAEHLLPWVSGDKKIHLQIMASQHFNPNQVEFMQRSSRKLEEFSSSVGGRIRHVAHYPPDREILERLLLSDLGYVYCPFDTGSASAAASVFVSARCPLVTSNSTHYDHLMCHTVRVSKEDIARFGRTVVDTARDPDLLLRLRERSEFLYAQTNYREFARRHGRIYGDL